MNITSLLKFLAIFFYIPSLFAITVTNRTGGTIEISFFCPNSNVYADGTGNKNKESCWQGDGGDYTNYFDIEELYDNTGFSTDQAQGLNCKIGTDRSGDPTKNYVCVLASRNDHRIFTTTNPLSTTDCQIDIAKIENNGQGQFKYENSECGCKADTCRYYTLEKFKDGPQIVLPNKIFEVMLYKATPIQNECIYSNEVRVFDVDSVAFGDRPLSVKLPLDFDPNQKLCLRAYGVVAGPYPNSLEYNKAFNATSACKITLTIENNQLKINTSSGC